MSRNKFEIPICPTCTTNDVQDWLHKNDFAKAEFKNEKFRIVFRFPDINHGVDRTIYYSLIENPEYTTYFKEGKGKSLLVIETRHVDDSILCESHSPILIFGFFRKEYKFIQNPSMLQPYLKEGFEIITAFKNHFHFSKRALEV